MALITPALRAVWNRIGGEWLANVAASGVPGIQMEVTIGKLLSLVIAIVYVVLLMVNHGARGAFEGCAVLLLPLALIWFPDELGSMMGSVGGGNINAETPAILVSIMGWFLLVGLPIILYFIWRSSV